jgi:hypothetical protein
MKEERTGWLARIAAIVALGQINIFLTMIAAFVLGAAAIFLTTAWLFGPKIQLEHSQYARFTASSGGRIVESWVALELDQSRVRSSEFWRASAKASATPSPNFAKLRRAFRLSGQRTTADLRFRKFEWRLRPGNGWNRIRPTSSCTANGQPRTSSTG